MLQIKTKQIHQLVKAVVNQNSVLPILSCVCLDKDTLTVTDLEVHLQIPYKSGITACIESKQFITATELMPEPVFTAVASMIDKPWFVAGETKYYGSADDAAGHMIKEGKEDDTLETFCKRMKYKQVKGMPEQIAGGEIAVKIAQGKKQVKVMGDQVENYPALPTNEYNNLEPNFTDIEIELIETAMKFTSDDDLRPAMTGIYFGDAIAATDAHRLFFYPIEKVKAPFILPYQAARILTMIGGSWKVKTSGKCLEYGDDKIPYLESGQLLFENENGIKLYARAIDARFPNYKVVVPQGIGTGLITADATELSNEIKVCMKFANTSTNQVTFLLDDKANKVKLISQDVDLGHEYSVELEKVKLLMKSQFDIAFNGKFMLDILNQLDWNLPVKIKLWGSGNAAIINDHFLIMPLMLNNP